MQLYLLVSMKIKNKYDTLLLIAVSNAMEFIRL